MINIKNADDNEWNIVRYLNPVGHNLRTISEADNEFADELDLTDTKFPVKIRHR